MHACDRAHLSAGSTVLVFGAGTVGLLCAAVSKAAGAKRVVIADIQAERVDFAVRNGFAAAGVVVPMRRPESISDKLAFAKEVAELATKTVVPASSSESGETAGHGVLGELSHVFECTGVESCLQSAIYVRLSLLEGTCLY